MKETDYAAALEEVLANIAGRYQIGFIPDEKKLDGKFHKLTVKVDLPAPAQTGSVVIRHRSDYLASPDAGGHFPR